MTSELATLLMFLNVNLRLIFLTLPMLPSHVSSPRLRITFWLHMARYKFYIVLYCIVYTTSTGWTEPEPESSRSVKSFSVSFFSECLELNHISSDLLALSWSLLDEHQFATSDITQSCSTCLSNNNNNNIHICIAPYGRNFRGADSLVTTSTCTWGTSV